MRYILSDPARYIAIADLLVVYCKCFRYATATRFITISLHSALEALRLCASLCNSTIDINIDTCYLYIVFDACR